MIAEAPEQDRIRVAGRFYLQDGRASETIGPQDQQFDVGPKTSEFRLARSMSLSPDKRGNRPCLSQRRVRHVRGSAIRRGYEAIHGSVEATGKRPESRFISAAARAAMLGKYGSPSDVTHVFTAGGTVLAALGSEPVPYLVALWMATAVAKASGGVGSSGG
jgi:phosphoglycerate kinase